MYRMGIWPLVAFFIILAIGAFGTSFIISQFPTEDQLLDEMDSSSFNPSGGSVRGPGRSQLRRPKTERSFFDP